MQKKTFVYIDKSECLLDAIIQPLQEKLLEHFQHIRVELQQIKKTRELSEKKQTERLF